MRYLILSITMKIMRDIDKKIYQDYINLEHVAIDNTNISIDIEKKFKKAIFRYDYVLRDVFSKFDKQLNILDLGCGYGVFAKYCQYKKIINYSGVNYSRSELEFAREFFPGYQFYQAEIIEYLSASNKKF